MRDGYQRNCRPHHGQPFICQSVHFLPSKHEWKIFQRLVTMSPNKARYKPSWPFNYREQLVRTPTTEETCKHNPWEQSKDQKRFEATLSSDENKPNRWAPTFSPLHRSGEHGKPRTVTWTLPVGPPWWVALDHELSQKHNTKTPWALALGSTPIPPL